MPQRKTLLSTTYFGPVQWYAKVFGQNGGEVLVEACESFVKQTYRNRCVIATEGGQQQLTIPVTHDKGKSIRDTQISDHGNWRHLHWQAIQTAYGESAFFEYYADELRPFYIDQGPASPVRYKYLLDYNLAGAELICRLLDIDARLIFTERFLPPERTGRYKNDNVPGEETPETLSDSFFSEVSSELCFNEDSEIFPEKEKRQEDNITEGQLYDDWRYSIRPKNAPADPSFFPKEYYQVYRQRTGFLPNLSILDLLFNEGPQSILTLRDCCTGPLTLAYC